MSAFRPCVVVPTYDNPETIGTVVGGLLAQDLDVLVIDDGSREPGRAAVRALAHLERVVVLRKDENAGKGRAVMDGFRLARELGFTHALQMDADGQHSQDDVGRFLEAARSRPEALVLGVPIFDKTAPWGRVLGRKISVFWCAVETLGLKIHDPLYGMRVYPLGPCARLGSVGARMDFDPEIAVRLVWSGVPTVNLATKVRYLSPEEGGVSHFRMFRDNLRISWMHTRLVTERIVWLLLHPFRRIASALLRGGRKDVWP